jgi:hypothetical protein
MKVLFQPYGGLGDNLQFTTLPERFSEIGEDFYISDKNAYRNNEIYELVWGLNPFVKGISSEHPNVGAVHSLNRAENESIVYNWELTYGFEPINRIPKIYYKPKLLEELKDVIFIDISSISLNPILVNDINDIIPESTVNYKTAIPNFLNSITNQNDHKILEYQKKDSVIDIQSIFHYCDVIHSCAWYVCSFSGGSLLSSALDKQNTVCIAESKWKGTDLCMPNINYHFV